MDATTGARVLPPRTLPSDIVNNATDLGQFASMGRLVICVAGEIIQRKLPRERPAL